MKNRRKKSFLSTASLVVAAAWLPVVTGCDHHSEVSTRGDDEQIDPGATGSKGQFSAKAFLEASVPWKVYRFQGRHEVAYAPNYASATRTKKYVAQEVTSQVRTSGINVGNGNSMFTVNRQDTGAQNDVEITALNNLNFARIDGTAVVSRLGFNGAATASVKAMTGGPYDKDVLLGHVESKKAPWARIFPHSFYYIDDSKGSPSPIFGLTVVEKMMGDNAFRNYMEGTGGRERLREGTYWCSSDKWKLTENALEGVFKSDEFDEQKCERPEDRLLSSETTNGIIDSLGARELGRQDSNVQFKRSDGSSGRYFVQARREWACALDCDGTTYSLHLRGKTAAPSVLITSNKWNLQSSTQFKVKIVRANLNGSSAFSKINENLEERDLRDIAASPGLYNDILAVLVSETADPSAHVDGPVTYTNATWTQFTYVIVPPGQPDDVQKRLRLLDAVLAAMPDQTQSSPELADVEEKLDELLFYQALSATTQETRKAFYGPGGVGTERLFDVMSEVDATTAVTWNAPTTHAMGKVEWLMQELGYSK